MIPRIAGIAVFALVVSACTSDAGTGGTSVAATTGPTTAGTTAGGGEPSATSEADPAQQPDEPVRVTPGSFAGTEPALEFPGGLD